MKYVGTVYWLDEDTGAELEDVNASFIANTPEEAGEKAKTHLLKVSEEFRDRDEFPEDEAWIEICVFESWNIVITPLKED